MAGGERFGEKKRIMEKVNIKSCISTEKRVDCNVRSCFPASEKGRDPGANVSLAIPLAATNTNITTGVVL